MNHITDMTIGRAEEIRGGAHSRTVETLAIQV